MPRSSKKPLIEIIQDDREKLPFAIPGVKVETLKTGDYSVKRDGILLPVAIERKGIVDLLGVIGGNRKRFERELERAKAFRYFAIVIEGTRNKVIHEVERRQQWYDGKLTVGQVMHSLAAWDVRGVHVHFEEDRRIAAAWTRALLMHFAEDWEG